jgi:hypothetical protein
MDEAQVRQIIVEELAKVVTQTEEAQVLANDLATRVARIESTKTQDDEKAKVAEKEQEHKDNVEKTNQELEGYMN